MYSQDISIIVSDNTISVTLPIKDRYQYKVFSNNWNGVAKLNDWIRDMGIKQRLVRVKVDSPEFVDIAIRIACRFSMYDNMVELSAQSRIAMEPAPATASHA